MSRPPIRAVLIDLSGTLQIGSDPTPSAVDALERLRAGNIPIRFCSNTSKESTAALRAKLEKIGFEVKDRELWTSLGALKDVVRTRELCNPLFLLSKSAMEEFSEFVDTSSSALDTEHDSVVVGLSPSHFSYDTLTKAFRVLSSNPSNSTSNSTSSKPNETHTAVKNLRPPLITTHRAKYIRTPDGELSLGPGPFVTALEDAVGGNLRAEVVGKPSREFFERVIGSIGSVNDTATTTTSSGSGTSREDTTRKSEKHQRLKYDEIAIIGDDIETDLGGAAVEFGLWRVLVKTGKYREGDEKREGVHPPDEVQDSFASFVDDLLKMR